MITFNHFGTSDNFPHKDLIHLRFIWFVWWLISVPLILSLQSARMNQKQFSVITLNHFSHFKWKDNFGYFENVDFNPFVLCDQFYQSDYFDILISYREPETVINILMWFLLITLINLYTIISFNHYEKYDNFDHIDLNYLFLFHQFYLNHLDLSNHLDYFAYLDLVNQHFNVSMFDHFNWFKN